MHAIDSIQIEEQFCKISGSAVPSQSHGKFI